MADLPTLQRGFGLRRIPVDNCRRIAFVYAPSSGRGSHAPGAVRLETMPFAINAIIRLAAADSKVDIFLWERPLVDYHEIFPITVRFYEVMPKRIFFYGSWPIQPTARLMSRRNGLGSNRELFRRSDFGCIEVSARPIERLICSEPGERIGINVGIRAPQQPSLRQREAFQNWIRKPGGQAVGRLGRGRAIVSYFFSDAAHRHKDDLISCRRSSGIAKTSMPAHSVRLCICTMPLARTSAKK